MRFRKQNIDKMIAEGEKKWLSVLLAFIVLSSGCLDEDRREIINQTTSTTIMKVQEDYRVIYPDFGGFASSSTVAKAASTSTTLEVTTSTTLNPSIETFEYKAVETCKKEGKPIIRMYSKSSCYNCGWSKPLFEKAVLDYVRNDSIVAHIWMLDRLDDELTEEVEEHIPDGEYDVFYDEEHNPLNTVPYFSFGCRYVRVGNGYQIRGHKRKEEGEFRAVIEQLLSEGL